MNPKPIMRGKGLSRYKCVEPIKITEANKGMSYESEIRMSYYPTLVEM